MTGVCPQAPSTAPLPTLLRPEAFSNEVRPPHRVANPRHHPLLARTLLSATAGAKETPSIERFHTALVLDPIPETEQWVIEVWLANATTRDLIRVWLDGGYSLQVLVKAMHALHGAHGNGRDRTETINRLALGTHRPLSRAGIEDPRKRPQRLLEMSREQERARTLQRQRTLAEEWLPVEETADAGAAEVKVDW